MHVTAPTVAACAGIVVFFLVAWLAGESRRKLRIRPIASALLVQVLLTVLLLRVGVARQAFLWLGSGISALRQATLAGTSFVFGYVGGGDPPFVPKAGGNLFVFGLQALPMVIVVSSLSMLFFHWGLLPALVRLTSVGLRRSLRMGGALGVCAAAKAFLGQTEAPLLIRPYLGKLSRSELFSVMTMGMATTSASIMVIYSTILE
ncbi:MAG: nucleoside:proton symporter, partial [Deltaproteobacteria bacterium]